MITAALEQRMLDFVCQHMQQDVAHDRQHVLRVVKLAKRLCAEEGAQLQIVLPAAYLHDCFSYAKDHPDRGNSSRLAADKALQFLSGLHYPAEYFEAIHHAIVAHSYSAKVAPETLEAKIVQDADRLDAIGAIGIARCMQVSASLGRPLYAEHDPFCVSRAIDDGAYTLDHFYKKLLLLAKQMHTASAKAEAGQRTQFMQQYLLQLGREINPA
ncbi:HD domain-containing protein [Arsukibacterium sp.]|uniref:HD domain-containing protein n=1 Tax=Arsukibacterium sp. TaxID=1977258 RepID=UPI002FD94CAE